MREIRTSGSEGGAGSSPVPTPILAIAYQNVQDPITSLRDLRTAVREYIHQNRHLRARPKLPDFG